MRIIDLVHRWTGGLIGLLLALLGLTGTLLLHKDAWRRPFLPHAADPQAQDAASLAATAARWFDGTGERPTSILFATGCKVIIVPVSIVTSSKGATTMPRSRW